MLADVHPLIKSRKPVLWTSITCANEKRKINKTISNQNSLFIMKSQIIRYALNITLCQMLTKAHCLETAKELCQNYTSPLIILFIALIEPPRMLSICMTRWRIWYTQKLHSIKRSRNAFFHNRAFQGHCANMQENRMNTVSSICQNKLRHGHHIHEVSLTICYLHDHKNTNILHTENNLPF